MSGNPPCFLLAALVIFAPLVAFLSRKAGCFWCLKLRERMMNAPLGSRYNGQACIY